MASVTEYVRQTVDPKAYYSSVFPEITWTGGSQPRVLCCFHNDKKTPSLHFNPDTGAWYCHGCEQGGKSIISFDAKLHDIPGRESAISIFDKFVHRVIPEKTVRQWARDLRETPSALKYLVNERMLTPEVIHQYKLGWNGTRIVIPVHNEFDLCVNAKLYDPLASKKGGGYKMLNYFKDNYHYGRPVMLYPLAVLLNADKDENSGAGAGGPIFIAEGELDALCLLSRGLRAVTTTAGAKSWPKQYNQLFRGREVVVVYDNDKDGAKGDRRVFKNLSTQAKRIKRLQVPKKVGKDVTDWVRNTLSMRKKVKWLRLAKVRAKTMIENPDDFIETPHLETVSLDEASEAKWYNKPITVNAMIAGKDSSPFMLPKQFRVTCTKECDNCPLAASGDEYKECSFADDDPKVLNMVDSTEATIRQLMLNKAGLPAGPKCRPETTTLKTFNVEQLVLIPEVGSHTHSNQYVTRIGYFVGHGLRSNKGYQFGGVTIPHPEDQHATHLFTEAKPMQDEASSFKLTDDLKDQLKVFRPKNLSVMAHLMSLAEWQSRNVTKIKHRPDIHIGMDLVFHSIAAFNFNGEYVHRGMLDVLIVGDTRCGKGYVAEGLVEYYNLGEVASGENCTFAGLIGGAQQIGRQWTVTWGVIPRNSDRLVVIDEVSSLTETEIGNMSRVRSEGVAEINKIVHESTRADTRLIWLGNPRSGRQMEEHNSGVQVVRELMGANEDISRFDFAMTVATKEVESEIINSREIESEHSDAAKYASVLCRSLVLWAWSRRPEQVKFTKQATDEVISQAITFGKQYSAKIPLVQSENIRIKIAKVSAAVAARTFSTDETSELLVVNEEHVTTACQFMRMCYDKPSMGYDVFSNAAIARSTIADYREIEKIFDQFGGERRSIAIGLLELHKIGVDNLADFVGDMTSAKSIIGDLVKQHCLTRVEQGGNHYLKNPAFTLWLHEQRKSKNGTIDKNRKGHNHRP